MPHDPRKLLEDIRTRAEAILLGLQGIDLSAYRTNDLLRFATERQFEIIGEAVSRLLKSDAALAARLTDYRKIIDFRNAISHGYDTIDDRLVWDAAIGKLPLLKRDVEALLAELK